MTSTTSPHPGAPQGVLLLTEDEVRRLLTMEMAIEAVEQGLRRMALDEAQNVPRARTQTDHVTLHTMSAGIKAMGVMGAKIYTSRRGNARFYVLLFDGKTGMLLAEMQADYLGQMRTGAASAVATQHMARPDATEVGIFGSGKQARTQLLGVCKVRRIRRAQVYSPNEEHRRLFAAEMSELCQTDVEPVSRPELAAENKDILITATDSREPVVFGHWLAQGTHINAVGSNFSVKAELDAVAVRKCSSIVVDSKDQARLEAGDLIQAEDDNAFRWADVRELGQVVVGRYTARRHPQDITLFKSLGIAIEDVAVAARVYARAHAEGAGRVIEW
jgi:ornithine cyclodeaminase/alanine dehydrogenase-like protein (mu-crystallin family)